MWLDYRPSILSDSRRKRISLETILHRRIMAQRWEHVVECRIDDLDVQDRETYHLLSLRAWHLGDMVSPWRDSECRVIYIVVWSVWHYASVSDWCSHAFWGKKTSISDVISCFIDILSMEEIDILLYNQQLKDYLLIHVKNVHLEEREHF